jgi:hypothetical protein
LQKASEYHLRAEECRVLAARTNDAEHKAILGHMAETWEDMAQQREAEIARKERLAVLDKVAKRS